ncbi:MAG: hypothetical protein D6815_12955 [Candidatus Dadabacteria bacterium]|nr:MAG: hypothetical protein D6815_12955 [Candidatus Dadabacteria bacterium]
MRATVATLDFFHCILSRTARCLCGGRTKSILGLVVLTLLLGRASVHAGVEWSYYLGGSEVDQIRDLAISASGDVYVTGGTASSNFPTKANESGYVYDATHNGSYDVFVTKVGPDGAIRWSTFIGGPGYDRAYAIELDGQGGVYIAGRAGIGFPVSAGVLQTAFQGGREHLGDPYGEQDGFVCKLTAEGVLVFCTYFGGTDGSMIRDIAIDAAGDLYLASAYVNGTTYPPAIGGSFLNSPGGGQDTVVAKISGDGRQMRWARYVGGSAEEVGTASVRVDHTAPGNVYLLTATQSAGLATPGAYDESYGGGPDILLATFDPQGALRWASYLGGSGNDSTETHELGVDGAGNAYVVIGTTSPTGEIARSGQTVEHRYGAGGGQSDIVAAKISADGRRLLVLTLLGGSGDDRAEGTAVDAAGNVVFTGLTASADFPVTADAVQAEFRGAYDALAVRLTPNLELEYSSYRGGEKIDYGRSAAIGQGRMAIFGGVSESAKWPVVGGAGQTQKSGLFDGILWKLSDSVRSTPCRIRSCC